QETNTNASPSISAQDSMRSYLQLQEQLHNLILSDEKYQQELAAATARSNEVLNQRLDQLEKTLASQKLAELDDMRHAASDVQRSGATVIWAAGAFFVFGFMTLFFAAFLQWKVVNRVVAVAARLHPDSGDFRFP